MALDTVEQLIGRARVLLQDTVAPYRYPDTDLINGLNEACIEAKRIRPDMFLRTYGMSTIPSFAAPGDSLTGKIPEEFRTAFIYYVTGNAQLRDEEDTSDQRAASLLSKFVAQLMTLPS